MAVRRHSGYHEIATGIFIPESWLSCAIRRMNVNAWPERFTRKVLRRNRLARYSRISMASTTARRAFRGCWTTSVEMFHSSSRALWRLLPDRLHRLRTHEDPPQAELQKLMWDLPCVKTSAVKCRGSSISSRKVSWVGTRWLQNYMNVVCIRSVLSMLTD